MQAHPKARQKLLEGLQELPSLPEEGPHVNWSLHDDLLCVSKSCTCPDAPAALQDCGDDLLAVGAHVLHHVAVDAERSLLKRIPQLGVLDLQVPWLPGKPLVHCHQYRPHMS